jgi:hypothetical protein
MDLKTLWVSEQELKGIWEALHEFRFNLAEVNPHIENILIECGVAESRAEVLYPAYERIAVSLGKADGAIPLKLSTGEYEFLSKIPLNQELKEILY